MKILECILKNTFFGELFIALCACSSPVAVITNGSTESIAVEIHSDVGESYTANIPAKESVRLKISGRDKQLWVVATFSNGRHLESERLYVTSKGLVRSTVTGTSVSINYEL